jgi:hypothetical protein
MAFPQNPKPYTAKPQKTSSAHLQKIQTTFVPDAHSKQPENPNWVSVTRPAKPSKKKRESNFNTVVESLSSIHMDPTLYSL